jgi:hypothetical protein
MTTNIEILDRAYANRQEARPAIQQATKHYREARRATIQIMADMRILQGRDVHVLYGYKNFSLWAEATFEGLAAGNVRQLTRAGAIALELNARGLIDLKDPKGIGTTGLRELSTVANEFGDDKMIEVFKTARDMLESGKEVSSTTVQAAMRLLMPPAKEEEPTESEVESEEENDQGLEPLYSPKVSELIGHIQDLSWDLPETADEIKDAAEQLKRELAGADINQDQIWIESAR